MNKIHITGYSSMIYFIYRSTFLTISLPMLLEHQGDSLLICLLGSILGFFLFSFYLVCFQKNKEKNIIVWIDKKWRHKIGFYMNTFLTMIIFLFGIFLLYHLIQFIQFEYLKNTSLFIIYILILGTVFFMASKDFDTISRASFIFLLISILFYFIKIFGLFDSIQIQNIKPIFKSDIPSLFIDSIRYAFYTTFPLFLLLLVSKDDIIPKHNIKKKAIWVYLFTSIALFLQLFLIIGVMGTHTLSIYTYPEFHLLSNVNILGFIDRLESILSIQWIIDMILCISLCFIYIKVYLLYYISLAFPKFHNKIYCQNNSNHT